MSSWRDLFVIGVQVLFGFFWSDFLTIYKTKDSSRCAWYSHTMQKWKLLTTYICLLPMGCDTNAWRLTIQPTDWQLTQCQSVTLHSLTAKWWLTSTFHTWAHVTKPQAKGPKRLHMYCCHIYMVRAPSQIKSLALGLCSPLSCSC